ncbi:hypothetical protein PIIN_06036 [Serendipita indica DSM 11827]|uniref:F-box domain-containing protein n=1 Tax=Serendipita indica (strain DSM 11827) TaxID=1109443 RepID=G4TLA7_SERID|nr:hypothetical protein PIIN_06036 [Serendipita indica DSM 11827]
MSKGKQSTPKLDGSANRARCSRLRVETLGISRNQESVSNTAVRGGITGTHAQQKHRNHDSDTSKSSAEEHFFLGRGEDSLRRALLINDTDGHTLSTSLTPSHGIAPMPRPLSLEILLMILDECHQSNHSLMQLKLTSKWVNAVIMNTPRFWRRVLVSVDHIPPSVKQGGNVACGTENILKTCIERARNSPLEATFVVGPIDESSPTPEVRRARFGMLMSHSSQITLLCIIIKPGTPIHVIKESFRGLFNDSTVFPALDSLIIASAYPFLGLLEDFRALLARLEQTSHKLRSVEFDNVGERLIHNASISTFWRKLHRIILQGEHLRLCATIFNGCKDLKELFVSGEVHLLPKGPIAPIHGNRHNAIANVAECSAAHESRLQSLCIGAVTMKSLQVFSFEGLKELTIGCTIDGNTEAIPNRHSMNLPRLKVLRIASLHSQIIAISAPVLHTLCLQVHRSTNADAVVMQIFHGEKDMWKPKVISLNLAASYDVYEHVFTVIEDIETLRVALYSRPSEVFYRTFWNCRLLKKLFHLEIKLCFPPSSQYPRGISAVCRLGRASGLRVLVAPGTDMDIGTGLVSAGQSPLQPAAPGCPLAHEIMLVETELARRFRPLGYWFES